MPSSANRARVAGDVGPQLVGQRDHGERLERGQDRPAVGAAQRDAGIDGAGEDQDPQARTGAGARPRRQVGPLQGGGERLGRAQHPGRRRRSASALHRRARLNATSSRTGTAVAG